MSMSDNIADLLTRVRNAQAAGHAVVKVPASGAKQSVLDVLQREGYVRGYSKALVRKGVEELVVELKYHEGQPVISRVTRVSKPGRRVYAAIETLGRVHNGLGISILSTSKGVLSDAEARLQNVGGEVLCEVF
jgi:small subunit ribosomal protein S8